MGFLVATELQPLTSGELASHSEEGDEFDKVSSVTNHQSSTTRSRFLSISIPCFRPIAGEVFVLWLLAFLFCRYSSREWLLRLSMLKLAGGIWVLWVRVFIWG